MYWRRKEVQLYDWDAGQRWKTEVRLSSFTDGISSVYPLCVLKCNQLCLSNQMRTLSWTPLLKSALLAKHLKWAHCVRTENPGSFKCVAIYKWICRLFLDYTGIQRKQTQCSPDCTGLLCLSLLFVKTGLYAVQASVNFLSFQVHWGQSHSVGALDWATLILQQWPLNH